MVKSYSKQETLNGLSTESLFITLGKRPNKYFATEFSFSQFEMDEGASRVDPAITRSTIKAIHLRLGMRFFLKHYSFSLGYDHKNAERILSVRGVSAVDPAALYYKENLHGMYVGMGLNVNLFRYIDIFGDITFTSNQDFNNFGALVGLRLYPGAY